MGSRAHSIVSRRPSQMITPNEPLSRGRTRSPSSRYPASISDASPSTSLGGRDPTAELSERAVEKESVEDHGDVVALSDGGSVRLLAELHDEARSRSAVDRNESGGRVRACTRVGGPLEDRQPGGFAVEHAAGWWPYRGPSSSTSPSLSSRAMKRSASRSIVSSLASNSVMS